MDRNHKVVTMLLAGILVAASASFAEETRGQATPAPDPQKTLARMSETGVGPSADPTQEVVGKGAALFKEPSLGTSGKSCNSCHVEMGMGTKDGPMGAKPLVGRTRMFPTFVPMTNRVVTLDQMTQMCIVNQMRGKALPWDSEELTALVAYQYSLAGRR